MPVRVIAMIGVTPLAHSSILLVIEGAISPSFISTLRGPMRPRASIWRSSAIPRHGRRASFLVAMHAAARTERLSYLVAHRPGFVAPTLFARQVATFDQLTGGRIALHVITGKTDAEQEGD